MTSWEFLQYSYFGNTVQNYLIAVGIFVVSLIVAGILSILVRKVLVKLCKKTETKLDDIIIEIINKVLVFIIVLMGVYFGLRALVLPQNIFGVVEKTVQVIFIIKVFQGITILVDFFISEYVARYLAVKKGFGIGLSRLLTRIVNIGIWIIATSMVLNLFGYDIGAIIAGLGIGGLAIALAAQDPLGNFFSSLSIVADKPFKVGDWIKFDNYEGIIKDIGMRTTDIETFFGTTLSIPNNHLAKAIVENVSKRRSIRADGTIGLVYGTSPKNIQKGIDMIKDILKKEKSVTNDFRAFFTEYGDSALKIDYTYYVKKPEDWTFFLKAKNKINLRIKEEFDKTGLEMAFPTQTIYLNKQS